MSPHDPRKAIAEAASEWLLAMSERTVSLEERRRFDAWLDADPRHREIYRAQKHAWDAIRHMPHLRAEDGTLVHAGTDGDDGTARMARRVIGRRDRNRRWALATAASVLLATIAWWQLPFGAPVHETGVAQIRDITLEDGSLVTLGASSRMSIDMRDDQRRVTLLQGEAFFEVARDTARPFLVIVDDTVVRVVGTKFDVRRQPAGVRVSVLEGRVEVSRAVDAAPTQPPVMPVATRRTLVPGQSLVTGSRAALPQADAVNLPDVGAWRSGRLVYVDTRLGDIVADANRYRDGAITISDPDIARLEMTATFRADQIDAFLSALGRTMPVTVTHLGDGTVQLDKR